MVAHATTVAFRGIDIVEIDVQVLIANGLPAFVIVGLPDKAVAESRERVRSALSAMGLALPAKRITVNLAPADFVKEGSHYDLPIALALLAAMAVIAPDTLTDYIIVGELGLDGALLPVTGVFNAAVAAFRKQHGIICPQASSHEASWADQSLSILAPAGLLQLVNHFKGHQILSPPKPQALPDVPTSATDLSTIKGQETAKRAIEIAASGGHHMLMIGPPGAGKTILAQSLPGLLPPLRSDEMIEVNMIASQAGLLTSQPLQRQRPFRNPHHSATLAALIGGGMRLRPGEVSLAHHGVLFLDELPEFSRQCLDALRQPIELGEIVLARANQNSRYPSRFQLIAAMNPCPCGRALEAGYRCHRGSRCMERYQARLSGPLIDRIDLTLEVEAVSILDLTTPTRHETNTAVAARIAAARQYQDDRCRALQTDSVTNAAVNDTILTKITALDANCRSFLAAAAETLRLSARGYHRILRVARTIADLDQNDTIQRVHLAEALSYRQRRLGGAIQPDSLK